MHLQRIGKQIVDADAGNAPVVFTGAFFRPFTTLEPGQSVPTPEKALVDGAGNEISITPSRNNPLCEGNAAALEAACYCGKEGVDAPRPAKFDRWTWNAALTALESRGINLVRVFATNGNEFRSKGGEVVDVSPFLREAGTNLYRVREAVVEGRWNTDYFLKYLRPFVDAAAAKNIAVQLCLFSYHEFTNVDGDYFKYWKASPWNPAATTPLDWGTTNLVDATIEHPSRRNFYFLNTANKVIQTQDWFLRCVVDTLAGTKNVILELFNEPRSLFRDREGITEDHRELMVGWYMRMVRYLRELANRKSWRPLISVNASDFHQVEGRWDIDLLRDRSTEIFAMIDIISYHGMTGFEREYLAVSPCPNQRRFAPVAPQRIAERIGIHFNTAMPRPKGAFPDQPLIFSTDAVQGPTHPFVEINAARPNNDGLELEKRDGQITTDLPYSSNVELSKAVSQSDLANWTYWSLEKAYAQAHVGRVHFQNHSIYGPSFSRIGEAKAQLLAAGELLRPAYTTAGWTQYSHLSDPHAGRNFNWAQRFLTAEGGSVTQLGTEAAPADPRWEMQVETGWRMTFTAAATRWCCFNIAVTPVSVSDREQGATVTPMVVARLHEVVAGALRPALASRELLLRPGATPNTISISGDLVAGRQYALLFAGAVKVNYHNRYQGYGEVIVHFPSVRKVG